MRVTALVLGVMGGVVGILSAYSTLQVAQLGLAVGASGSQSLLGGAVLAMAVSIAAIVGGGIVGSRPRTAAVLMIGAAVLGLVLVRSAYLIATAILVSGGLLAYLSRTSATANLMPAPSFVGGPRAPTPLAPNVLPTPTAAHQPEQRSMWIYRFAWLVALGMTALTWWFWVIALFTLVVLSAITWVPRVGPWSLRLIGWRNLPIVGDLSGFRASAALLGLAIIVVIIGSSFAPRPQ